MKFYFTIFTMCIATSVFGEITTKEKLENKGFFYLKLGGSTRAKYTDSAPSEGFGYRTKLFKPISGAIDLNIIQVAERHYKRHFSTEMYLPRLSYHYYPTLKQQQSFFFIAGVNLSIIFPKYYITENDEGATVPFHVRLPFMGEGYIVGVGYDTSMYKKYLSTIMLEFNLPGVNRQPVYEEPPAVPSSAYSSLILSYCIGY